MKKLHKLLFGALMALCLVSFASCSDDNDGDIAKSDVVGTWERSALSYELDCEPKSVKDAIVAYYERMEADITLWSMELGDNNELWIIYPNGNEIKRDLQGTYTIDGNKIYISEAGSNEGEFHVSEGTLKNGQLKMNYDLSESLKESIAHTSFPWQAIGIEKPANFKVNKFG